LEWPIFFTIGNDSGGVTCADALQLRQLFGCGRVDVNFFNIAGINTGRNDQAHQSNNPYGYYYSAVLHFILLSIDGFWIIPMSRRQGIFENAAHHFSKYVNKNLLFMGLTGI
jgi:hypothetical protein